MLLVQQINPLTNEAEWVVMEEPGEDGDEDESAQLVSASSYLDMLTDHRRNRAYKLALHATIRPGDTVLDIGTGTGLLAMMAARCLIQQSSSAEAGAGAGAAGTRGPPVTACEVFPPMASLARRVIEHNRLSSWVRLVPKRSDDMTASRPASGQDPSASSGPEQASWRGTEAAGSATATSGPHGRRADLLRQQRDEEPADLPGGKADVLVTEIFDSQLLGEGLLPTLRHAVPHLLKPGGRVVPSRARIFGQLVECGVLRAMSGVQPPNRGAPGEGQPPSREACPSPSSCPPGQHPPDRAVEQVLHAVSRLDRRAAAEAAAAQGGCSSPGGTARACLLTAVRELHVDGVHAAGLARPLSAPRLLTTLELSEPPEEGAEPDVEVVLAVESDGVADALVIWWQLDMDPEGQVLLSTAPCWVGAGAPCGSDGGPLEGVPQRWRDHWKQCWAPLVAPGSGAAGCAVSPGDAVTVRVAHDSLEVKAGLVRVEAAQGRAAAAVGGGRGGGVEAAQDRAARRDQDSSTAGLVRVEAAQGRAAAAGPDADAASTEAEAAAGARAAPPLPHLCSWVSPLRLWQMQDAASRWRPLLSSLLHLLQLHLSGLDGRRPASAAAPLEVVVVGDGPLLPLLVAAACSQALDSTAAALGASAPSDAGPPTSAGGSSAEARAVEAAAAAAAAAASGSVVQVVWLQDPGPSQAWLDRALEDLRFAVRVRSTSPRAFFRRLEHAGAARARPEAGRSPGPEAGCSPGPEAGRSPGPEAGRSPGPEAGRSPGPEGPPRGDEPPVAASPAAWGAGLLGTAGSGRDGSAASGVGSEPGTAPRLVVSEPYFRDLEGTLPWFRLRYWSQLQTLRRSSLPRRVHGLLAGAHLRAVAVALPELWRSRLRLSQLEGLDLSPANAVLGVVGPAGDGQRDPSDREPAALPPAMVLPYTTWQCGGGYQELSQRGTVLRLDFEGSDMEGAHEGGCVLSWLPDASLHAPAANDCGTRGTADCHAIVVWMDWQLASADPARDADAQGGSTSQQRWVISEAPDPKDLPQPCVQAVLLLQQAIAPGQGCGVRVDAVLSGQDGSIKFAVARM